MERTILFERAKILLHLGPPIGIRAQMIRVPPHYHGEAEYGKL